jgi:hypothetical protein
MGWSFRKSKTIGKGLRVNLSRSGVGLSLGSKLLRVGISGGRTIISSGFGLFRYRKTLGTNGTPTKGSGLGCFSVILLTGIALASTLFRSEYNQPKDSTSDTYRQHKQSNTEGQRERKTNARTLPTGPAVEASKRRAVAAYPDLGVANSPLNRLFVAKVRQYQTEKPAVFDEPEWPSTIAKECVSELGR